MLLLHSIHFALRELHQRAYLFRTVQLTHPLRIAYKLKIRRSKKRYAVGLPTAYAEDGPHAVHLHLLLALAHQEGDVVQGVLLLRVVEGLGEVLGQLVVPLEQVANRVQQEETRAACGRWDATSRACNMRETVTGRGAWHSQVNAP